MVKDKTNFKSINISLKSYEVIDNYFKKENETWVQAIDKLIRNTLENLSRRDSKQIDNIVRKLCNVYVKQFLKREIHTSDIIREFNKVKEMQNKITGLEVELKELKILMKKREMKRDYNRKQYEEKLEEKKQEIEPENPEEIEPENPEFSINLDSKTTEELLKEFGGKL